MPLIGVAEEHDPV